MESTLFSIIEKYNQKNDFITKIWVWIAIISLFGIVVTAKQTTETIEFPIIDITIPSDSFIVVFILVQSGLIIRWTEATHRNFIFRQVVIEPLIKENDIKILNTNINKRKLLDGMVSSTTTSVWGLVPDFKQSKNESLRIWIQRVSYLFLKFIVMIVHFILPGLVIGYLSLCKLQTSISLTILVLIIAFIAILAIILTMVTEIKYIIIVWQRQLTNYKKMTIL